MPNTFTERTPRTREIEALVLGLSACATGYDIFKCLQQIKGSHNFEYFSVVSNPTVNYKSFKDRIVLTNWSADLVEYLSDRDRLDSFAFAKEVWTTPIPLAIDYRNREGDVKEQDIFRKYVEKGHNTMVILPLHAPTGFNGYVSFSGKRDLPSTAGIMEIAYFCSFVHQAISRAIFNEMDDFIGLDQRQLKIVKLLTKGNSIKDIASKLGLSVSGVNFHIHKAMALTGCKTRIELVAMFPRLHIK